MRVTVNGESQNVADGTSIEDLVLALGVGTDGIAVAVGSSVVPRSSWEDTKIEADQTINILTAVQGG